MHPSTQSIVDYAAAAGVAVVVREFPEGTKTAQDAATAVGCDVGAIVKSLVFTVDDAPVLALIPGDKRLNTQKLAKAADGERAKRADLETVRRATGYVAGGTPPFAHATPLAVYGDPSVERFDELWVAGGTPHTVFSLSFDQLVALSGVMWADLIE